MSMTMMSSHRKSSPKLQLQPVMSDSPNRMDKRRRSNEHSHQKTDPFERVHQINNVGLKILTMGMIPPQEAVGKIGLKHVILHLLAHLSTTVFGIYELAFSFIFSGSFIELLSHWYVGAYCWGYGFHFAYMNWNAKEISSTSFGNEHFYTTKMVPGPAEQILKRNMDSFLRFLIVYSMVNVGTMMMYIGGAIIDVSVELATTGTVKQIFVLSYYSNVPLWGQAITSITNIVTGVVVISTILSVFIMTGIRAVKIKTQCEIMREALSLANVDIKSCIQDHIELIKAAKRSFKIFKTVNNPLYLILYSSLAIQLVNLSLIEPTGSYFFSMGADLLSTLLTIHSQCWFSATITLSLESIAESCYFSPWRDKNKSFAKEVIIMMNMAQRPIEQKILLDALTLGRATTLKVIQSSYSFYTMLMILQSQN